MLCVIAKIDEDATAALQRTQRFAARHGARPRQIHGHITLVSYIGEDEPGFLAHCRSVLRDVASFAVEYEAVSVMPATNIIVASPCKTEALLKLHSCLGAGHWEGLDQWSQKGAWEPHTTLVYDPGLDLGQLCGRMRERFKPFTAHAARIEFSRVSDSGYEIVDCIDLKPAEKWEK